MAVELGEMFGLRLSQEDFAKLDALQDRLSQELGTRITRSAAVRALVSRAYRSQVEGGVEVANAAE